MIDEYVGYYLDSRLRSAARGAEALLRAGLRGLDDEACITYDEPSLGGVVSCCRPSVRPGSSSASPSSSVSCSPSRSSSVWLLVYDRQSQSEFAQAGIAEGWGGPQAISGPSARHPLSRRRHRDGDRGRARGDADSRSCAGSWCWRPSWSTSRPRCGPERRKRSIYEVVVYEAAVSGRARFAMPARSAAARHPSPGSSTSPAPNCASASPIRAGSAPIRGSPPAAGRFACSPAAAHQFGRRAASSPGSTRPSCAAQAILVDYRLSRSAATAR